MVYGIYGASGCGRGIMPLARRHLAQMTGPSPTLVFIDDAPTQKEINGYLIVTFDEFLALPYSGERHVSLAIADGRARQRLYDRCTAAGVAIWSITADNAVAVVEAGAEILVAGSAIFGTEDPAQVVQQMLQVVAEAQLV